MNSNPSLGTVRQSMQYLQTIMTSASADSKLDARASAEQRTSRPVVGEVRRSKCGRARGNLGSSDGTASVEQKSELPLFSPPPRTREEELQRVQLIEGGKKNLKKLSLQEPAAVLSMKDFPHAAHVTRTAESSSSGRRHSYSGPRRPRSISTANKSHHDARRSTDDLGSRRPRSISTATKSDHDESTLTNDLLNLLISEMARMRSALESLVGDGAVVEEIRRTNRLLALALASGRSLEGYDSPSFHPLLAKKVKDKSKPGEIILDSI